MAIGHERRGGHSPPEVVVPCAPEWNCKLQNQIMSVFSVSAKSQKKYSLTLQHFQPNALAEERHAELTEGKIQATQQPEASSETPQSKNYRNYISAWSE